MLRENEKRTILSVVFGVALVSFVTAAVACFTNSITVLVDYPMLDMTRDFYNTAAYVLLALGVLCAAYFVVKLTVKKTFIPCLVIASVILAYVLTSLLVLRFTLPTYRSSYSSPLQLRSTEYTFFEASYFAVALTVGITVTLTEVSHLLLLRMNAKKANEEQPQPDQTQE